MKTVQFAGMAVVWARDGMVRVVRTRRREEVRVVGCILMLGSLRVLRKWWVW